DDLLRLADHEEIEKWSHWLGRVCAGTTSHHERIVLATVGGEQRNARQIEHRQHRGVAELGLQRETHQVEIAHRRATLPRKEWDLARTHLLRQVEPGH